MRKIGIVLLLLLISSQTTFAGDDQLTKIVNFLLDYSPGKAHFYQRFTPVGNARLLVEEEGTVYFKIPKCTKWEYLVPFRKNYLVCNSKAYYWLKGSRVGEIMEVKDLLDIFSLDFSKYKVSSVKNWVVMVPKRSSDLKVVRLKKDNFVRVEVVTSVGKYYFHFSNFEKIGSEDKFKLPTKVVFK